MCGEKNLPPLTKRLLLGSPPHVRGKACHRHADACIDRITPACAGKRHCPRSRCEHQWDHPRMCGEKNLPETLKTNRAGSPPHVRGKAKAKRLSSLPLRITPACAGKRLKRSRSTVPHAAIVPLFPSVCNKPAGSDGSPAGHDAPPFLPIENAAPASPAYNLRSL